MKRHVRGADTLEGITRWWITGQRLTEAEEDVREAIEFLCHRGFVQTRTLADGTVLYCRADRRREAQARQRAASREDR
jgi:hypothetical protein